MNEKGILIIISGPSGSGKGTVVEKLKTDPSYALSISATTRQPRNYEQDGVHYFFKTVDQFKKMIEEEKKKGPESYDDCTTRTHLRIRRKTLAQIL